MKKILNLLILLLPVCVFGQHFNGGLVVGGVVSQIDGDTYEGYHKYGFHGGGFVNYRLSKHSQLQLEMQFIQKGSRKNANLEKEDPGSYLLRLNYLEVPVLYQYIFMNKLYAEVGLAPDVLLGNYEEKDGLEVPYNTVPLRKITLGGIIGVSYALTRHLKTGFRMHYSLLSIREPQPEGYPEGFKRFLFETGQFNNLMSLSISWDFKPMRP